MTKYISKYFSTQYITQLKYFIVGNICINTLSVFYNITLPKYNIVIIRYFRGIIAIERTLILYGNVTVYLLYVCLDSLTQIVYLTYCTCYGNTQAKFLLCVSLVRAIFIVNVWLIYICTMFDAHDISFVLYFVIENEEGDKALNCGIESVLFCNCSTEHILLSVL